MLIDLDEVTERGSAFQAVLTLLLNELIVAFPTKNLFRTF